MEKKKILLIDDEEDILEIVSYHLKKEGYEVFAFENPIQGIEKAIKIQPDLILLDMMMPQKSGLEVLEELRKIPTLKQTLMVFLSAKSQDFTQLSAYEAGADDYIVKEINSKILLSKIKALLKLKAQNQPQSQEKNTIKINDEIKIDQNDFCVYHREKKYFLPKKEFELLYLLASNPHRVFSREEILSKIWGDDIIVTERTIDVHIRRIREKLGGEIIQTLKGIGYKILN